MTTRDERFLATIRSRLAERPKAKHPGPWTDRPHLGLGRSLTLDSRIERFTTALASVGGHSERVTTPAQLRTRLEQLRSQLNLEVIAVEGLTLEDRAPGDRNPSRSDRADVAPQAASWFKEIESLGNSSFASAANRGILEKADAGVTWADWGIAETGSVVLLSAPRRSRLVSLLPPVHIALLPAERLVATRDDVFARVKSGASDQWPTNVVIATGPSRTADIENDLSIGVHGPGHVHVFILE